MALSRKFHMVTVNRDRTPDIPKRFDVSSYPTLLLLGDKDEKVHRFSGFKKPEAFVVELQEGERRFALYRAGKEWDEAASRPPSICAEGAAESFPAPSEAIPQGLVILNDRLWVAQGEELCRVDPRTGKVETRLAFPAACNAITSDGKRIFACSYGWTAGEPIHVIDPETGEVTATIVTEENKKNRSSGAAGIAWRGGRLWILEGMHGRLNEIDPDTGAILRTVATKERWLYGLAFDGKHFVAGGREALRWIDPDTGATLRQVKLHYPVRCVAAHEGAPSVWLMEQPVFGHDKEHQRVQVWPKSTSIYRWIP